MVRFYAYVCWEYIRRGPGSQLCVTWGNMMKDDVLKYSQFLVPFKWEFKQRKQVRGNAGECMETWKHREREMDELLLLVHGIQRTWARFRKRYCCWRLICVWRKWRERRGRNHPTGRKRTVEVMAGVEVAGLGSCLIACSTNTHTQMHTQPHSSGGHSFLFPASGEKEGHSK